MLNNKLAAYFPYKKVIRAITLLIFFPRPFLLCTLAIDLVRFDPYFFFFFLSNLQYLLQQVCFFFLHLSSSSSFFFVYGSWYIKKKFYWLFLIFPSSRSLLAVKK